MRLLMTAAVCIVISPALIAAGEDPVAERIQAVRKAYRAVPPDILDVKEPIKVQWAGLLFDGGTIFVKAEDAEGRIFHATLASDESYLKIDAENELAWIRNYQSERIQIGFDENVNRGQYYPIRGPEEAALYGLLIRWSEEPHYEGVDEKLQKYQEHWTKLFVRVMDHRFASLPESQK